MLLCLSGSFCANKCTQEGGLATKLAGFSAKWNVGPLLKEKLVGGGASEREVPCECAGGGREAGTWMDAPEALLIRGLGDPWLSFI